MRKTKPCPRCKGETVLKVVKSRTFKQIYGYVECTVCHTIYSGNLEIPYNGEEVDSKTINAVAQDAVKAYQG